ncbi:hypothetical protein BJV77DRAFT_1072619 [Russula vinacea]|nr:hypothetical protein BJV77DRAFT_1072619 [Russula vinacea]
MSFADLELSQSAFLNPGQLPWSESKSDFKVESPPAPQPVFFADHGSYAFYNDSNTNPAVDSQLFASQPQPHAQPSEMLTSAPQQVVYFAENEMDMEGDLDLHYPTSSPSPHALSQSAGPHLSSHPRSCRLPSAFQREREQWQRQCARPETLSSECACARSEPHQEVRGRRVPTAPVIIVQGGVQKNMRMYRCTVDGCYKCFARGEHLKRHVRSIHTNEKPHKCPVEGCGKDFSRHDNLGQHMRVHKGQGLAHMLDA